MSNVRPRSDPVVWPVAALLHGRRAGLCTFNPYAAGYRIQKLRKAHGLTQEEAAIKLNISDRHMRSLEKGTYAPLDLFVEIAVHFDVTLDYLILGKVETKTELALSKKSMTRSRL